MPGRGLFRAAASGAATPEACEAATRLGDVGLDCRVTPLPCVDDEPIGPHRQLAVAEALRRPATLEDEEDAHGRSRGDEPLLQPRQGRVRPARREQEPRSRQAVAVATQAESIRERYKPRERLSRIAANERQVRQGGSRVVGRLHPGELAGVSADAGSRVAKEPTE